MHTGGMKMLKKRMLTVLAVLLSCAFLFTGCKQNVGTPEDNAVPEEGENADETEEDGTFVFGFTGIDMENPYFITLEKAIREVIEENEYQLVTKDPASDPETQAAQIQEMIDEGVDAVFLCPVDWEKITPSLEALKDAGIYIINVDTQVKEMDYVDAYVGSDNYEAGYICGEDLVEKCPDGGTVAILECPTQNSMNDRKQLACGSSPGLAEIAADGKQQKKDRKIPDNIECVHPNQPCKFSRIQLKKVDKIVICNDVFFFDAFSILVIM